MTPAPARRGRMPSNDWQGARAAQPLVRPGPEPSWASGAVHRVPTARVSVGMLGGRRSARSVEASSEHWARGLKRSLGEGRRQGAELTAAARAVWRLTSEHWARGAQARAWVPVKLNLGAKGHNRSAGASSRAPCEGGPGQCQVWVQVRAANARTRRSDGSKARGVTGRCGGATVLRRGAWQADAA